jgi:large subunit ribosomal protein L10
VLKAAFINGDIYMGNDQLVALTKIKTKNELIGEVIGLLQSPARRVIAALLNHAEKQTAGGIATAEKETKAVVTEVPKAAVEDKTAATPELKPAEEAKPVVEAATKSAEDAEIKPADDAETKPTEE